MYVDGLRSHRLVLQARSIDHVIWWKSNQLSTGKVVYSPIVGIVGSNKIVEFIDILFVTKIHENFIEINNFFYWLSQW